MKNRKVIVIGAGPAGIAAGYKLAEAGYKVEIYEETACVGGMARSFELFGQKVDCGPHRFFSKEKHINSFFTSIIKDDYTLVNRLTRIYYNKRFFDYPLKLANVVRNLSLWVVIQILVTFFYQKIAPKKELITFEDWVTNRFGKKLFNIFFENYSEKLWGIPCSKIDADWAAQRIKSLTLFEAVKNAIIGDKTNKHKTLVDQFAYPKGGSGAIYEKAADKVMKLGGEIRFNSVVSNVLIDENNKVYGVRLLNGDEKKCDIVISTMPITTLVQGLHNVPEIVLKATENLYFRNTILVYLEADSLDLFSDNWIYVHSPLVKHGRITNFRNWCPSLRNEKNTSIVCVEYWAFDDEEMWKADDEYLSQLGTEEIRKIKLIPDDVKILNTHVLKIPKCYPVYEIGYQSHLKVVSDFLDEKNGLIPIGRYGSFKYNNQDHSILMGIMAARNIIAGENHNLWNINTDTEYHEAGKIKDVLVQ